MQDVQPPPTEEPHISDIDPFSPDQRRFLRMLALSVMLHLILLIIASGLRGGGARMGTLPVVDVSLTDLPVTDNPVPTDEPAPVTPREALPSPLPDDPADAGENVPPPSPPDAAAEQEPSSISFSISAGSFMSFGEGSSLKDELRPYFLEMLERINRSWQHTGRGVRLSRGALLLVSLERDGKIREVRILQGSGNRSHDRLLVAAVEGTVFSPLPESYGKETFEAPIRFSPPLSLLSLDNLLPGAPPH